MREVAHTMALGALMSAADWSFFPDERDSCMAGWLWRGVEKGDTIGELLLAIDISLRSCNRLEGASGWMCASQQRYSLHLDTERVVVRMDGIVKIIRL